MNDQSIYLERIALALECIAKHYNPNFVPLSSESPVPTASNFITHFPQTLEEELFILTSNIYLDEAKRKLAENLKRKSSIKVSQSLLSLQIDFLSKYLSGYDIYEGGNSSIIISKNNTPISLIRFYSDLGFHRGSHWKNDINNMLSIANNLGINKRHIFLVVLSNSNGLDNQHICSTLNQAISNKDILEDNNIDILRNYCNSYIKSFSSLLPNPHKQLFFLASKLHPNGIAEEIFNNPSVTIDLVNTQWLSTPLNDILTLIKSI